jgi:adenylate cyclase
MNDLSIETCAERAGVDPAYVARLIELGVIAAVDGLLSESDARRVAVVQGLEQAGLPLDGIAGAITGGRLTLDFVEQAGYEVFASLSSETFRAVSARTGVPLELLVVIREAIVFAQPEPDDPMRNEELRVVPLVKVHVEEGFQPSTIERWLRVYGDNLRRVADTEADWYRREILGPLFGRGLSSREIAATTARVDAALSEYGDEAVLALYHGPQANAWMKNIFEGFEGALAAAGVHNPSDRPPAICFLDLTGYTRLTDERGDEVAADLAASLARIVQRSSVKHGGKAVKWLGDGVMFWFRDGARAVVAALEMVEAAAEAGLPPAHVGLHAGPVLFQQGDYFGRTVNVAARIADYARQGEVLVSQEIVDVADDVDVAFTEIGPVELKGVSGPVRLHVARRAAS